MAENQSRLPTLRSHGLPLAETSLTNVRTNSLRPPELPVKRKLAQPTSSHRDSKLAKSHSSGQSLQKLGARFTGASGIARPASAAGTTTSAPSRHASSKSVDVSTQKKMTGVQNKLTRGPTTRSRAATAMDTRADDDSASASVLSMNSMNNFPSCSLTSVNGSDDTNTRQVSAGSSIKSLINDFGGLCVTPRSRSRTHRKAKPSRSDRVNHQTAMSEDSSPKRPPNVHHKASQRPVTPNVYLTMDSNRRVPAAFDVESKMSDLTTMLKSVTDGMGSALEERNAFVEASEAYKNKIIGLEASRVQLEENNALLRRELEQTRSALAANKFEADQARRSHLDEIGCLNRKHRDETDDMIRKHKNETDDINREAQRLRDEASLSAKDDIKRLEKRHCHELEDLRRELTWSLEQEQRSKKQMLEDLQTATRAAQEQAKSGEEQRMKEMGERDHQMTQLTKTLDHEREINSELRSQIGRGNDTIAEFENTCRSLRAQVEFLKSDSKSQSQAFADLEQQTQDALRETEDYRSLLRKEESIRRKLLNQIQDLKGNIRVFCRVRPPLPTETGSCARITFPDSDTEAKEVEVLGPEEKSSLGKITTRTHAFNFDRSFGPVSDNAEIFAELSELVAAVCGGSFNTCVFSYGQTGSGKTYTMASPDGMIARAVNQIFETAATLRDKGWRYNITGSFVEVYNENINDLLGHPDDFDKKKHEIRHNATTLTTEITDVLNVDLDSSDHFITVLEQAMRNRSIAATKANERSSRSHSVCILKLHGQNSTTGETCSSTLNLVDLAGSERLSHSQATGSRLRETQNINKSLSCLADVIAALGEARDGGHIPYRNSKLTYLLQNSLGGNSKTLMFVMISPLQEHLSETLSSLNFATKVNNTRIIRRPKR